MADAVGDEEAVTKQRASESQNLVSIYSGPLHNNRLSDGPTSDTERQLNIRIFSKNGYSWDQNDVCANIRLGDGAILQNLYPRHSHVKLLNGVIERIDVYSQRFQKDARLYKLVTLIRDSEYDQWARTKRITERDLLLTKPIPLEKLESRSTQPTWDTIRNMTTPLSLGLKNPLFSYDDLVAKFSDPKFLKRLGLLPDQPENIPESERVPPDQLDNSVAAKLEETPADQRDDKKIQQPEIFSTEIPAGNLGTSKIEQNSLVRKCVNESEEAMSDLLSDDEEYHRKEGFPIERFGALEALASLGITSHRENPERVPSSLRSSRQQLEVYNDIKVIGSNSKVGGIHKYRLQPFGDALSSPRKADTASKANEKHYVTQTGINLQTANPTAELHRTSQSSSVDNTVKLQEDGLASLKDGINTTWKLAESGSVSMSSSNSVTSIASQPVLNSNETPNKKTKDSRSLKSRSKGKMTKTGVVSDQSRNEKYVPFSQPVCLCPKLSNETLNSLCSPIQHYFITRAAYLKCKLHGKPAIIKSL